MTMLHHSTEARTGFRMKWVPSGAAAKVGYPVPDYPPPTWFGARLRSEEAYESSLAWTLSRLPQLEAAALPADIPIPQARRDEGQHALMEVLADPIAYWITCCWAAHEVVRALSGPLPLEKDHRYSFHPSAVPERLKTAQLHAAQMTEHAAGFLTAVAHHRVPRLPLGSDYGTRSWRLMLCLLLDAAGNAVVGNVPPTVLTVHDPHVQADMAELDRLAAIREPEPKRCAGCRAAPCACTLEAATNSYPCFHCGTATVTCAAASVRDPERGCCSMCEFIWGHERNRSADTSADDQAVVP